MAWDLLPSVHDLEVAGAIGQGALLPYFSGSHSQFSVVAVQIPESFSLEMQCKSILNSACICSYQPVELTPDPAVKFDYSKQVSRFSACRNTDIVVTPSEFIPLKRRDVLKPCGIDQEIKRPAKMSAQGAKASQSQSTTHIFRWNLTCFQT